MATVDDGAFEEQLRNEMRQKFSIQSNGKKRKLSFNHPSAKKQKTSHNSHNTTKKSKSFLMDEFKQLGLVQNKAFPQKDNSWKNKKNKTKLNHKKHKIHNINHYNSPQPSKRRKIINNDNKIANFKQLHNKITIYPFRNHLWYNLDNILTSDPSLNGENIKKEELFNLVADPDSNQFITYKRIYLIAKHLYDTFVLRDPIKNEFHSFTLNRGTFADKISTWILRINQFALTRLNHIDSMLNILRDNIKRQAVAIIPNMIQLFTKYIPNSNNNNKNKYISHKLKGLLPDRHLMTFNDRLNQIKSDNTITNVTQMDLILWYYENLLKKKYLFFIDLLEYYSTNVSISKLKYLSTLGMYKLLNIKAENELIILNLLINKFGENDKNYVNRINDYLLKICSSHPLMKPDLIRELNNYLMRPSLSPRGLYRGVFFLTKLRFTSLETEAATLVCSIYMDLFKQLIQYQNIFDLLKLRNGEHDNNNNNNNIFADDANNKLNNSKNKNKNNIQRNSEYLIMKKLIGLKPKKRGIYFKTHKSEQLIWRKILLYEEITPKLLACILRGISYAFPFANLNIQIFKNDLDYIYKLILKSNMKIALMALQFTFRVESTSDSNNTYSGTNITDKTPRTLIKYSKNRNEYNLISRIIPSDRFYCVLYSICSRWDFVIYSHPELLFNLIYQCIKIDNNRKRITAFVRRLIQFSLCGTVSWNCGALYLFSAILKIHPFLINMLELNPNELSELNNNDNSVNKYDLNSFRPSSCGAHLIPIWELTALLNHMHPAVTYFTKQLINKKSINYNGDPIKDFKRKILFEKFTKILAYKTNQFKPSNYNKNNKNQDNNEDTSYIDDRFIAIYKKTEKKRKKDVVSIVDDVDDDDEDEESDLDEDNESDKLLADQVMFKWLKHHYGSEIPDDQFDNNQDYDYSDLKKEIQNKNKNKYKNKKDDDDEDDGDDDMDIYMNDIDKGDDDEYDMANMEEFNDDDDEDEDDDHDDIEKEKIRIGNEILFEDIQTDNILLPSGVEYVESDYGDEDDDLINKNTTLLDKKNDNDNGNDDDGDFFAQGGFAAGELKID